MFKNIEKKRKRTRVDEVPEREKKDIVYAEENQLQMLLKETRVLTNTQSVRERTPLSSIIYSNANEADGNYRTSETSNYINETSEINLEHNEVWKINIEENSPIIDIRSAQRLCATTVYRPPTFPHPAYAQFIEIVMKYHLPNSVDNELISWFNKYKMNPHAVLPTNMKQGHTLLDSMNISHILYTKTVIMKHNGTK
ncbi:2970_t:CDS:2 [Dentiscutata erythropus]|uniref:2970_t:CDS:1 n=1 Tax=Dentiscutata erythropus TaxID=1348616 RepID=A0A9N8Z7R4_9GLOM|nr:2970_t:CDS:2 [Dentiscutata erythropus]